MTVTPIDKPSWPRTVVRIEQTPTGSWLRHYDDGTFDHFGTEAHARGIAPNQPGHPGSSSMASSWHPLDLTRYVDGSRKPVIPTLLHRTDDTPLAYPGRVHWLSGEPESLKSWLALLACTQVLNDGGQVAYLDFEDSADGIVSRLLAAGVAPDVLSDRERFTYHPCEGPLDEVTREQLATLFRGSDLLVIDACTEALAAQGLTSKDDTHIAAWLALLPRWAARLGPAVLVLDHVVKDADNRGRWASGSGHKLAGLDGAAYTLEAVQPGGVGLVGRSRLYVQKDRHGQVRPHAVPSTAGKHWLADFIVDSTGPFVDLALFPPTEHSGTFIPTVVMGKVSDALATAGRPLTKSEIEDRVTGRAQIVRQAIAALEDAGHIQVTAGAHNSKQHTLIKPYPEADQ